MTDTIVSETVTKPLNTPVATGSYFGAETIDQNGQALTLSLFKSENLSVAACSTTPQYTISSTESLVTNATKVQDASGMHLTVHFSLSASASTQLSLPNQAPNPFNTNLSISGDIVLNVDRSGHETCHVSYSGNYCGEKVSCSGSGQIGSTGLTLNADTAYSFADPGGDGYAALIINNGHPTTSATGATVTNTAMAEQGAISEIAGAGALLLAFGSFSTDPVKGYNLADAAVTAVMGGAAAAIIACPTNHTLAVDATLAATYVGALAAIGDTLAAYDVAASHGAAGPATPFGVSAGLQTDYASALGQMQHANYGGGDFPFG